MNWFTGLVVYLLIWWITLFAVLPFGARPVSEADKQTGWRGAPEQPMLLRKVVATTLISAVIWVAVYWLTTSDWLSFRHGWLAPKFDD